MVGRWKTGFGRIRVDSCKDPAVLLLIRGSSITKWKIQHQMGAERKSCVAGISEMREIYLSENHAETFGSFFAQNQGNMLSGNVEIPAVGNGRRVGRGPGGPGRIGTLEDSGKLLNGRFGICAYFPAGSCTAVRMEIKSLRTLGSWGSEAGGAYMVGNLSKKFRSGELRWSRPICADWGRGGKGASEISDGSAERCTEKGQCPCKLPF